MEETESKKSDRICLYCNANEIDDEFHLILVCDINLHNRQKYINKKYWKTQSVYKLLSLLHYARKTEILNVCMYIHKCYKE